MGPTTLPARAWVLETGEMLTVKETQGRGFDLTLPGYLPDDDILAIGME
jgi:hypothetical protein